MLPHRCLGRVGSLNTTSKGQSLTHIDQAQDPGHLVLPVAKPELSVPQQKPEPGQSDANSLMRRQVGSETRERPARWQCEASVSGRRPLLGAAGTVPAGSTLAAAGGTVGASHSASTPGGPLQPGVEMGNWVEEAGSPPLGRLTSRQQLRAE